MRSKTVGIVLAGGQGVRFGNDIPKQLIKIAGKTIIEHTIEIFEKNKNITEIIVVIHPQYYDVFNELMVKSNFSKLKKILKGGDSRRQSSYIGICACDDSVDKVLIHDAVRPFLSDRIINDMIEALEQYPAVDVAIDCADTIIEISQNGIIKSVPNRQFLRRGQTPQAFKLDTIRKAHKMYLDDKSPKQVTDDCSLVLDYALGDVYVVEGEQKNIKITYPEDVFLADKLFQLNSSQLVVDKTFSFEQLKDKVLVVFGFSSGIGEKVFDLAKQYEARVYGFSRRNDVDITSYNKVGKALEQVYGKEGRIDFVVNTAGVLKVTKLENLSEQEIFEQININLIGSVNVVRASIPYVKESKGMIILFGSSSYTRGRAFYSLYSACKSALVNFVQAMADELAGHSARINIISPARTDTPMRMRSFGAEPKETLLAPDKVADVTVKTLFSELTGSVISVDL